MAFNFLQKRIEKTIKKVKSKGVLSEENISEILSEIRLILLESDVNLKVADNFIKSVKKSAIDEIVDFDHTASQTILKIINNELINLLGKEVKKVSIPSGSTIMMVGLQGSGKTTSVAKIANYLKKKEGIKKPLLVALDVYRPAAIDQLENLANKINVDFFANKESKNVKQIAKEALSFSKKNDNDLIIVDTAGRLETNKELMDELVEVKKIFKPNEIIFVADAMSGQEIGNVAQEFHDKLNLTSSLITKLDSDAKGGAALSIISLLNIKLFFIGVGEKIDDLELFHPDRMASRLLGLGDIETLTEKVAEVSDEKKQEKMMRKMLSGHFDLVDLLDSIEAMSKVGSISKFTSMIPGLKLNTKQAESAEGKMENFKILVGSMTMKEKRNPKILKHPKRKNRIIKGSGRTPQEFNELLRQFEKAQKQMKEMAKYIKQGKMPNFNGGFNSFGN